MKKIIKPKNNKERTKRSLYKVLLIVCILVIIYNAYVLINWVINTRANANELKNIERIADIIEIEAGENAELVNPPDDKNDGYWKYINFPFLDVNLKELKNMNNDTVGFIAVSGTDINYPIVQTKDNNYYLKHSFKKEKNKVGWIFADYRNNLENLDRNTVIYGHNMLDGTMFGTLKNTLKSNWISNKENYVVKLSTFTESTVWQVFSIYVIPVESYYININFNSDDEYEVWLSTMIRRSKYNFNVNVDVNDKILTLSTCYSNNTRMVMQAKLIKSLKIVK